MQQRQKDGIGYLTFAGLSALTGVRHGIFTRHGGVSRGPFASLNVGRVDGEAPEHVVENRRRVAAVLGGGPLVGIRQVHGRAVKVVTVQDAQDAGAGPATADALVTNVPGVLLMVQVADCQPVLLCDPVHRAVAVVHAGWRGSVVNVVAAAVRTMQDCYGSWPGDLVAGIGPSLGPCCGEFVNYRREIPETLWAFRIGPHHFDFWAVTRAQLCAAGVAPGRIETAGLCTRCRTDTFFSYRKERTTGRFAAVIGMAPEDRPEVSDGSRRTA
ncbi:MAG TPA: peptidoglycan editing factor PgeF [Desulfobacteraceae bacterium]|nr:peptidoglycan editing factor PgeF [Deltaproteobacteria bacterium]HDI59574.1 peptidoglycan editing factor PgeF [Desulfobacteraceae bacterium]